MRREKGEGGRVSGRGFISPAPGPLLLIYRIYRAIPQPGGEPASAAFVDLCGANLRRRGSPEGKRRPHGRESGHPPVHARESGARLASVRLPSADGLDKGRIALSRRHSLPDLPRRTRRLSAPASRDQGLSTKRPWSLEVRLGTGAWAVCRLLRAYRSVRPSAAGGEPPTRL